MRTAFLAMQNSLAE
jgi:amino acid permease